MTEEGHMNIQSEIENRAREIEQILAGYLPAAEGYQQMIMEAMRYSFLSGGKRLRPMLMLEKIGRAHV